ncbi:telomerase reverse transcriptase isoform X3 [Xenopus tropicalis]|uniref:Telomerase reverse transcriptase n=2 Tax=Xenopus tropicalis TaxID=8364 RepID=A0A8J1JNJ1_XENTR|nr:telomerase reverse transcriptase isoform X3 [Xenopus tropicalis]
MGLIYQCAQRGPQYAPVLAMTLCTGGAELLSILHSLYGQVLGIVEYIDSLHVPGGIKVPVLQEGDPEKFKSFVAELMLCIPRGTKSLPSPVSFLQLSTQREVVARVIQRICEKKRKNVLAFGYGLVDENSSLNIRLTPNICSYFPNSTTTTISTSILWETLLTRVGDDVMMYWLEQCSVFVFVPPSCCYQISGQPIYTLPYDSMCSFRSQSFMHSNVLLQYIKRNAFFLRKKYLKPKKWWKTVLNSKVEKHSKTSQMLTWQNKKSTSALPICSESSMKVTTKIHSKRKMCTTDICDIPTKKRRVNLDKDDKMDHVSFTSACLSSFSNVCPEAKVQATEFITSRYGKKTKIQCPKSTSYSVDGEFNVTLQNNANTFITNASVPTIQSKTSFSNIFIEIGRTLYSSISFKKGFSESFILNSLDCTPSGSQKLVETIFLNNFLTEQNFDQPKRDENFRSKLPKRYWRMRKYFQELIQNHKNFPYLVYLNKHCPVRPSMACSHKLALQKKNKCKMDKSICDLSNTSVMKNKIVNDEKPLKHVPAEATFLPLLKQHSSSWQVYMFVRECLNSLVPDFIWGSSHNKCRFLRNVKSFLFFSGKFGKVSLLELMWKMKVEDCSWIRLRKSDHFVPASEHLLRERILAKFIFWLMDTYVIQLLKSFFFVTETMFQKNRLLFYRKRIWKKLQNLGLRKHLEKVKLRPLSCDELEKMQQWKNIPLVSRLRFIPKTNGLRPISRVSSTLGSQQSKENQEKKIQHFTSRVRNLFSVLNYEWNRNCSLIGSSVFGMDDIYKQWKKFVLDFEKSRAEKGKFYFVKTDVKGAYDTIPHSKLDEVILKVINPNANEVYCIRRYASVSVDSTGRIIKSFKRHVSALADVLPNMKQFVSKQQEKNLTRNTILVEQSLLLNESSVKLLAVFQQMIRSHILRIEDRYYMQCCGIPQGSMLSTILCSLCYGDMENKLFGGIQQNGTLAEGIPQYGCSISPQKTVVNFPVDDIPACSEVEQLPVHCLFRWCGLLLDTQTLDVYYDYSSYACTSIRSSMTFCHSSAAGKNMKQKLLRVLKLKCHSLFLDLQVNSLRTVFINTYKIFLLQAYRFHACVVQLPFGQRVMNNPPFFLTVISDMAPCFYTTFKSKNKDVTRGYKDVSCQFNFEAVQWLSYQAFLTKLRNHKILYKCLIGPLHNCKMQLSRRLSQYTIDLLKAVTDSSLHKDFSCIMD